ncbi:MAG: hypothetical protein ACREEM_05635 [Blastocatellia bacterium]
MLAPKAQPTGNRAAKLIPRPIRQTRLLLVSDSAERLKDLLSTIDHPEFDLTCVSSFEEFLLACRDEHDEYDVAVLDVLPTELIPMLKAIRTSEKNAGAAVLVEASRVNDDMNLAGVLPLYRAMPCSQAEMIALLRKPGENSSASRRSRGML